MRPKKTRWIACRPGEICFRPQCRPLDKLDGVVISIDEYEVFRLSDLESLQQDDIALQMRVHRSTISRILKSARMKVADALVNGKAIKVEGGTCTFNDGGAAHE